VSRAAIANVIDPAARPGGMNSKATKRQPVKELLILGWERT
jgi:hypothetical protein